MQSLGSLISRIQARLQVAPPSGYLWGALLRRKFTRAGIIIVLPGSPWPHVINRGGIIECGNSSFFPGVRLECLEGGRITIGDGTYLNRNTEIIAQRDVRIGRNCKIAWDVVITDTDQHSVGNRPVSTRPVVIEDEVWIGCRALILKGVTIGKGAIIGAGAIVTKDVPAGAIVTGPAASIRGYVSDEEQDEVAHLPVGSSSSEEASLR